MDIDPIFIYAGIFAVFLIAGLIFFITRDSKAAQRRKAIINVKRSVAIIDNSREQRKKQVLESLNDFEKRSNTQNINMQTRIEQAGLSIKKNNYIAIFVILGISFGAAIYFESENIIASIVVSLVIILGLPNFLINYLRKKRIANFIDGLPAAIDIITRGIKAGLPLSDTIRIISVEAKEPVKSEFRRVAEEQSLGMSMPEALRRLAKRVPATESNFFAIVIEIQSKAGGNLSEALGNLAKTLRTRKAMKAKISAMSMEAVASAAIIGAVPFFIMGAVYMSSPDYMILMFTTNHGRIIFMITLGWMSVGAFVMKNMINFDF